jgi:hypothetical protein
MSWSRGTVTTGFVPQPLPVPGWDGKFPGSSFFDDGQEVSGWVFEPGYVRALAVGDASRDTFLVGHVLVMLELDTFIGQLVDRLLDIIDAEIENGVGRWFVIFFRVDQDAVWSGDLQAQAKTFILNLQPKRSAVELLGRSQVADRKPAERVTSLSIFSPPTTSADGSHLVQEL